MILRDLHKRGVVTPPSWMLDNMVFMAMMGSVAYGASGNTSDIDVYGFAIPRKDDLFPPNHIPGFGIPHEPFQQWQQHHVRHPDKDQEYDFQIFSIVKIVNLAMENNPNCVDALFVPRRCILFSTEVGERIREHRRMFLSKRCLPKFRGYAMSQMSKIKNKVGYENPARAADIAAFGYSTKYAMHLIRLMLECEQILETGDLDLERDREVLKSIRRGEWTLERIENWFGDKERHLEDLSSKTTLRQEPDVEAIRDLLMSCLEHHYGSLDVLVRREKNAGELVREIQAVLARYS
jgi:uncharacterized protein